MAIEPAAGPRPTLLVVDSDVAVARLLADALGKIASRVWVAHSAAEARRVLGRSTLPDLVLLELVLPDADGLMLCSEIRSKADVPVIICGSTADKREAVLALKLGADDFIRKPFDLYELEARVEAVLRRTYNPANAAATAGPSPRLHVGTLTIDPARKRAVVDGTHIAFTSTEYRLLCVLAAKADRIVSRKELARSVWDREDVSAGRTIDVHMRRIRMKLQSAPGMPPAIATLRGFGYRLLSSQSAE